MIKYQNDFKSLHILKNENATIAWGKSSSNVTAQQLAEQAEVLAYVNEVRRNADSFISHDNKTTVGWGPDLDSEQGRILKTKGPVAQAELQGGIITPYADISSDSKGLPSALRLTSKEGNFNTSATWEEGQFRSLNESRILPNGVRETMSMQVDPVNGTLTYLATRKLDY